MTWLNDGELLIGNKIYSVLNRPWIENILNNLEKENDNDTPKDKEASESA